MSIFPFSPAEKTGFWSIVLSALLFAVDPAIAALPLAGFFLLCLGAPFFPRFSFFLPVISQGADGVTAVAITFDDGPSPDSTPELLRLLDKYHFKATFFVIGEKAAEYPELIDDIVAGGHTIGNHSYRHDPFLMLKSYKKLKHDIQLTQEVLQGLGVSPLIFRPPSGITNPRLKGVLAEIGLITVNFSCRIFDRGNRNIKGLAEKVLARLRPGQILLLHDLRPGQDDFYQYWLDEIDRLLNAMQAKYNVLPLEEVILRPVGVKSLFLTQAGEK